MNKEEEMFLRIINSYSRKIMPPFSLEEHALIKYENFCKELIQENKQLIDNWNKLKEWSKHQRKVAVGMQSGFGTALCDCMMNKMQELEKGDSNEFK